MHAIEPLRWKGLVSLLVLVVFGSLPLFRVPHNNEQSISQLWALDTRARVPLGIIFSVFGAGFCLFLAGWLIPTYALWPGMYAIVGAAYVGLLFVVWVPLHHAPGAHSLKHPHFIGGALTACTAVVGYGIILLSNAPLPLAATVATVVALAYSLFWPAFFLPKVRTYFLPLEMILVGCFVLVILTLTV